MQPAVPPPRAGELDGDEGVAWLLVVADEDRPALLQPGERALDQRAVGGVAQARGLVELLLADPAEVRDGADRPRPRRGRSGDRPCPGRGAAGTGWGLGARPRSPRSSDEAVCSRGRSYQLRTESKKLKAEVDAELEPLWQRVYRIREKSHQESTKHERYCREQRELLHALEDLTAKERVMHELDSRKDQIMIVCKLALANLAMWVRDRFFPATYAHATWQRLLPFFRLSGRVQWGREVV